MVNNSTLFVYLTNKIQFTSSLAEVYILYTPAEFINTIVDYPYFQARLYPIYY